MTNKTPNIRVRYREALERLRAAEDEAAAVKARYDNALALATANQKTIEREVAELEDLLDRAIAIADQTPTASVKPKQAGTPTPTTPPASSGGSDGDGQPDAPPYLREVLLAMPRDAETGFKDIMASLDIARKTLNTRLAKAKSKKWGLVKSAGHGRYELTDLGRQVRDRYAPGSLQLVPTPTSSTGN
jgi:hypothetical protein